MDTNDLAVIHNIHQCPLLSTVSITVHYKNKWTPLSIFLFLVIPLSNSYGILYIMTNNGILQGNNPKKERENEFFSFFWVILLSDSYGIQYYNT